MPRRAAPRWLRPSRPSASFATWPSPAPSSASTSTTTRAHPNHFSDRGRGVAEDDLTDHPVIVAEADAELDPARLTERADQQAERLAALGRLKPDERSALLLLGLGLSYREIAERRAWTYTKVNRCLAEGRAALRQATQVPTAPTSPKAPRRASRIAPSADPPRS